MDYEKKYKEALERFKTFREKYCTYGDLHFGDVIFDKTGEAQKDLDAIFPELTESEDERMIKAIEHILYENYSDAAVIEGVEIAEIVTWLEKPKEPIDPFDTKLFQDGVKEGRRLEREDIKKEQQHAEWSEEDKQWLSDVYFVIDHSMYSEDERQAMKKYIDSLRTQPKPAEWSEEDETMLRTIISDGSRGVELDSKQISWLKSLRPQPKQNVSDTIITPNKEFFQWIYDRLVNVHNENPNVDYMISFKRRIEELSVDKPSWKPSEQEKGALRTAIHILTEERNFPKTAAQLQNILVAFEGKESRKDWKPSEEQMRVLKQVEDRVAMKSGYWEQVLDSLYLDLIKL